MKNARVIAALIGVGSLGFTPGCGHDAGTAQPDAGPDAALASDLLDPHVCGTCHQDHFKQWSGSMHAYASQDPVFLAMNKRLQRENPSLGTFCLKCHAPMAVLAGKTTDGLNLPELTAACANTTNPTGCGFLGVTCYFCHSIDSVDAAHEFNAGVTLASDLVMRGEITDPVPNLAHGAKYSPLHDFKQPESAALCGACHDIDSPAGGHIERTFAEWKASPYSGGPDAGPGEATTCTNSGCHMKEDLPKVIAVVPALGPLPLRTFFEHDFPAVDQAQKAQTPFPNAQTEQVAIQQKLANSLQGALCFTQGANRISVVLDTVGLGHDFPSGAAQDRRLWTEVIAYDPSGNVLYQSGVVPDGMSPVDVTNDPDMWLLRDCMFGTDGGLVDMFWQGATYDPNELPPIASFSASPATSHKVRLFPKEGGQLTTDGGALLIPASITLRLRLQPIGIDVLNDLASTGDLDAGLIAALPPPIDIPLGTDNGTILTWTPADAADGGILFNLGDGLTTCVGTLVTAALQSPAPAHMNPECSP